MKYLSEGYDYKFACDGYDLIDKFDGNLLNPVGVDYVTRHCKLDNFDHAEDFISECVKRRQDLQLTPRDIPSLLCDKYQVGYFETSVSSCFDSPYILFNKEELDFWKSVDVDLWGLKFMVVPSRDIQGNINDIGFRLLNQDKVKNVFKWLFPLGQQATFGLHLCDINEQLLLVEGFQDMIAFRESGYTNVVGLGSAKITKAHLSQLKTDNYVFCQDMDRFGMTQRTDFSKTCFFSPEGKDPYEAWQKYGRVNVVNIETK